MKIVFILFIGLFWQKITINAQCNSASGTNAGTITPTATFQTVSGVNGGNYYIVNANPCKTYTFSFCPAVGNGSASFDTQITVTDLTGAPIAGAYNDDYCGVQSCLVWQPSTSGNVRVYITQYSCQNTGTGGIMAYAAVNAATNTPQYSLLGTAVTSGSCTTLTNTTAQTGCAWNLSPTLNFTANFSRDFIVNLGNNNSGGDGMTFVMQNDPRGLCACGGQGSVFGASGIANSIAIEIDTYLNTEDRDDGMAGVLCTAGPEPDHLDIWLNGNINPAGSGCPTPAGARIIPSAVKLMSGGLDYDVENGLNHIFRISWATGSPGTLTAKLLNAAATATYGTVSYTFNPLTLFGTNTPYFGFTAATGGVYNTQSICDQVTPLSIELSDFEALKENAVSHLYWKTETEKNNKQFEIERSADGSSWKKIATILSEAQSGNSYNSLNYNTYDTDPVSGANYYRLKEVDRDLSFKYSAVKVLYFQDGESEPRVFPNPANESLTVSLGKLQAGKIRIYNSLGQLVHDFDQALSTSTIDISGFNPGFYFISISSGDKQSNYKILISR
jgi:hypothetical protein